MIRLPALLALLTLFVSNAAQATRFDALLLGGGCEYKSEHSTNLFDQTFELTYRALKNSQKWNIDIQYGNDSWEKPWLGAVNSTYENLIHYLDARLKGQKALKKGDQLLIAIATHGSRYPHSICLGDNSTIGMAEFIPYIQTLVKRGVKIAFTDASCYSGNSANLLGDYGACVLTEGNPNTTGDGDSFTGIIYGQGLSTEDKANPPSPYGLKIPAESPDLNHDGKITLAEAFRITFLRAGLNSWLIPRTTDCTLSKFGVVATVDKLAPFLKTIRYVEESADYFSGELPVSQATLQTLAGAAAVFEQVIQSSTQTFQAKWLDDLKALGRPNILSPQDSLIELKKDADLIKREVQNQSNPSIDAWTLKSKLMFDVTTLVDFACELEKQSKAPKNNLSCSDFKLF